MQGGAAVLLGACSMRLEGVGTVYVFGESALALYPIGVLRVAPLSWCLIGCREHEPAV
jgi:hypothetical protein